MKLGILVKDRVTGFTGVTDNCASYQYGVDRYCIQPQVNDKGELPLSQMIDVTQLVPTTDPPTILMEPIPPPREKIPLGSQVRDPVKALSGTLVGRAIYLNGCVRVLIEPEQIKEREVDAFWIDEERMEIITTPSKERPTARTGGPAPSSSKW